MITAALKRIQSQVPTGVTLVAVSKTKPIEMIEEAYAVGQRDFGENRPQELQAKAEQMPDDVRWHMIGHLQTNKVKYIIDKVYLIHAIDSLKLLEEVNKRAGQAGRKIKVLLQLHIAKESSKFGFEFEALRQLFVKGAFEDFKHVELAGLMGMATFTDDQEQVRSEFRRLVTCFEEIVELNMVNHQRFKEISMGMSGDYSIAIEEGSTMVRIGSSIFGTR